MIASELRIGDFVELATDDGTFVKVKVVELRQESLFGLIDDKFMDELQYHEIEPIPLTAEILEKNKYYYNDIRHEWATDSYSFYIEFGHGLSDEGQPDHLFIWVSNCEVELNYVHELQHALRLCGSKKEIEI